MRAGSDSAIRKFLIFAVTCLVSSAVAGAVDSRGSQFIGLNDFSPFERALRSDGEMVLTSPALRTQIDCDELVASWNVDLPANGALKIEARALYDNHATKFYVMGLWSRDAALHPRESVRGQRDTDGDVLTDTLKLNRPANKLQLRLTLTGDADPKKALKFVGLSLLDSRARPTPLPPNRRAWGKTIAVPQRSQMHYPNGGELCSPTTVSMLMTHWSVRLNRPELDHDVPDIVSAVNDPKWPGTGNWPFNMAYAGSFPGVRACVARFTDVSELEDWIAAGIPVGISVCYNKLRGKEGESSGHLVVCIGFTQEGDVIVNDPGTTLNVRKTFPRANLVSAWEHSQNTVYLVYPEQARLPRDRFGHWESKRSRQNWSVERTK